LTHDGNTYDVRADRRSHPHSGVHLRGTRRPVGETRCPVRIALALHYAIDLSVPQVAAVLSVPDGTDKSRIHAGVERLRAALVAEDKR
jgi:hypothetical protein